MRFYVSVEEKSEAYVIFDSQAGGSFAGRGRGSSTDTRHPVAIVFDVLLANRITDMLNENNGHYSTAPESVGKYV